DRVLEVLEIQRLRVIAPHRDKKICHLRQNPRLELPQVQTAKAVLFRAGHCISKIKIRRQMLKSCDMQPHTGTKWGAHRSISAANQKGSFVPAVVSGLC